MRYNKFKPRTGAIVLLCTAVVALWLTAVYGTYEDNRREKYDIVIKPGEVAYGTHSNAVVPMTITPTRPTTGVPMVSAGAVRSYAHSGHATMPTTSTTKTIHTTSSATVKTVGSGGAVGSGASSSPSGGWGASSNRGIVYGSPTISLPTIAKATPVYATQTSAQESATRYGIGPRRVHDNGHGGYDGDYDGEAWEQSPGVWYIWDEGAWRDPENDDSRKDAYGNTYEYHDGVWVWVSGPGDPGVPVGATPWLMMLILGALYLVWKKLIIIN